MKKVQLAFICLVLMSTATPAAAAQWTDKHVARLQPDHPSSQCYYFILEGVAQADPVRPGVAWFAIDRTNHPGAKELYATLLAARISGLPITVITDGTMVCGHANVSYVMM